MSHHISKDPKTAAKRTGATTIPAPAAGSTGAKLVGRASGTSAAGRPSAQRTGAAAPRGTHLRDAVRRVQADEAERKGVAHILENLRAAREEAASAAADLAGATRAVATQAARASEASATLAAALAATALSDGAETVGPGAMPAAAPPTVPAAAVPDAVRAVDRLPVQAREVASVLGLEAADPRGLNWLNLAETVRAGGLPTGAVVAVVTAAAARSQQTGVRRTLLSDASWKRRRDTVSAAVGDRVLRLATVVALTRYVWHGDVEGAREFLMHPSRQLGGKTPLQCSIDTAGVRAVEDLLLDILYEFAA